MVEMTEFRARYPKAWLPAWLDDVELLGVPSRWSEPGTQVWVAAIFWAMGDRSFCPLVQTDQERARELQSGFGRPVGLEIGG